MLAISYQEKGRMVVSDVCKPSIQSPSDALLRVTTSGICGTDLHIYEGRTGFRKNATVGHEIMGVIEEKGSAVAQIQQGDRVVLPFNISCGSCFNCAQGNTDACLITNPDMPGAAYGLGMGPYDGGQAEFVLVPYADFNCLKLPGIPGDEWEEDFLMLADVYPSGYHATELAGVKPGKTVAIFGAGPVGLLAAHSSILRGASEVYVVDSVPERLAKAQELGAVAVNFAEGDPVEQIFALRKKNRDLQRSPRSGEEKRKGVDCVIDAVGYQARDHKNPEREKPTQVLEDCLRVVNACGHVGIIGAYLSPDPGGDDQNAKQGVFPILLAEAFYKGLTIGTGRTPVKRYNEYLRDLIVARRSKPSTIVSHRIAIKNAPEAYAKFDQHAAGYTKVVISFIVQRQLAA